ncbi:translation initiation factor IF-1A [Candidatus Woesearchaeota archaeon]|nr:translation initiation factor IF-1A [Candidatus Woesearchaeota archaeon]
MKKKEKKDQGEQVLRVRLPRGKQVLGIVETRLGYGKSKIICTDGKTRICKVPGHLKRYLWVRPNNIVLVEPWELEGDKKGNIIYRYNKNQENWLKKKGYLKGLIEKEEF